jgi:hypothetical protein
MESHAQRRILPPLQEVIFYANFKGTPFTSRLPPLKIAPKISYAKRACNHKSNRIFCAKCDGRGICKHGKNRYVCIECGGAAICKHKQRRYLCPECKLPGKSNKRAGVENPENEEKKWTPAEMNAIHAVTMLLNQQQTAKDELPTTTSSYASALSAY